MVPEVSRLRAGVEAGVVAAAATGGLLARAAALAGDGATAPFAAAGRRLLGIALGDGAWAQRLAVAGGIVVHVALAMAWGVALALVAWRWRGARFWAAVAALACLTWALDAGILPPLLRGGHGIRASRPQAMLLHTVLALTLAIGMRLAQQRGRVAEQ